MPPFPLLLHDLARRQCAQNLAPASRLFAARSSQPVRKQKVLGLTPTPFTYIVIGERVEWKGKNRQIPMVESCELVGLLTHLQQCISKSLEDALKDYGLSVAKYNILNALAEGGGRLPFSTLVEQLGCVRSNVTGLVDRLQEDGLVRRVDHPEDRRMLFAELTEAGQALFTATAPGYDAAIERVFGALDEKQRDTLGQLLRILQS